jgi:hypothetical protein
MACLRKVHITTCEVTMPCHFCSSASRLWALGLFTLAHSNSPERRTPKQVDPMTHVPFDGRSRSTPDFETSRFCALGHFVSLERRISNVYEIYSSQPPMHRSDGCEGSSSSEQIL